jgi:hypothetical protein
MVGSAQSVGYFLRGQDFVAQGMYRGMGQVSAVVVEILVQLNVAVVVGYQAISVPADEMAS